MVIGFYMVVFGAFLWYFTRDKSVQYEKGRKPSTENQKIINQSMKELCRTYDNPAWAGESYYDEAKAEKDYTAKAKELDALRDKGIINNEEYRQQLEPYVWALSEDSFEYLFGRFPPFKD